MTELFEGRRRPPQLTRGERAQQLVESYLFYLGEQARIGDETAVDHEHCEWAMSSIRDEVKNVFERPETFYSVIEWRLQKKQREEEENGTN